MSNISFVSIGNKLLHQMRDRINNSEDRHDLATNFSYTMKRFLDTVLDGSDLSYNDDDVYFSPNAKDYYEINPDLIKKMEFKSLLSTK